MNNNTQQEKSRVEALSTGKRAICSASVCGKKENKISPDGVEMCKTIVVPTEKPRKKSERATRQTEIFSKYVDTELGKHFSDSTSDGKSTANKNSLAATVRGVITTETVAT
jgi:hypothetical protein